MTLDMMSNKNVSINNNDDDDNNNNYNNNDSACSCLGGYSVPTHNDPHTRALGQLA